MAEVKSSFAVKVGLAQMLKGGVIMDVVNEEQARIAEEAGAVAGAWRGVACATRLLRCCAALACAPRRSNTPRNALTRAAPVRRARRRASPTLLSVFRQ